MWLAETMGSGRGLIKAVGQGWLIILVGLLVQLVSVNGHSRVLRSVCCHHQLATHFPNLERLLVQDLIGLHVP
ncbi:hypothetical protein BJY04DRAFT_200423 [Aspergillus karnatakaensis]|uniref:uncharacterized protein n=1 Tax=Aspergillus karnatakaensis TaxID=1810916 RepID=UPI003CCD2ABB